MPRKLKYSSNIKDKGLLSRELKTAAELHAQGLSYDAIVEESIDNNVFQVNTERRRKELADCIVTRMKYLDDFTLNRIAEGTIFLANIISVYAIMKTNPLVYEFMNEVYREKSELMINRITDADINQFMDVKAQQVEMIAKWKDDNKDKVKGAIRNILVEAGMMRDMGSFYMILVPVLDMDLVSNLQTVDGDIYLRAMGIRV
ncbi:DUF1819 family protein [Butyrivibrio sp. NC2007]|uniref:DUF1819 family protein n=1 Tax=Butyrivibrio sp. NC2007 TaxID=1280683 RepID=UPI0003B312F4|nr:DUF1819 family protein [Butyrivibrio sp. NC2007]